MKCPFCDFYETRVIDSRPTDEGQAIRRRRECVKCNKRFTTYENIEEIPLIVVKKDGNRQSFNRNKLLNGIVKACEKRPVSIKTIVTFCIRFCSGCPSHSSMSRLMLFAMAFLVPSVFTLYPNLAINSRSVSIFCGAGLSCTR